LQKTGLAGTWRSKLPMIASIAAMALEGCIHGYDNRLSAARFVELLLSLHKDHEGFMP